VRILDRAKSSGDARRMEAAGAAMMQLNAVWRLDERVRSSVYATVQTVVQPWLDPAVADSATIDDPEREHYVDLDWLAASDRANTLYLVAPLDDQARLAPVLGGLLGDLKDQAYQRDVAGQTLQRPLLMVIDEAGNMPLAWLPEVAATCAGIGILLVTIWQSKAQLDAAYGRLSDSVLTNHLTKIVFAGCSDPATLDYVSRLLGDEEVAQRSVSFDVNGAGRRSISESLHREALTPFHLLRQVRPGEAVMIHGTLPPAHLHGRRWWADRRLRALADARPQPTRRPQAAVLSTAAGAGRR
jgi:type IV secretion system protein VirD4